MFSQRAYFESLKASNPGRLVAPSYLRLERTVNGTFNSVNFYTLGNENSPLVTEKRLEISDAFAVTKIGLFISKVGNSTSPTDAQLSSAILRTYPNASVFSGAGALEAANLMAIYNGYLSLTVDQKVVVDSLPTNQFYQVPQTIQGVTTTAYVDAGSSDATTTIPRDQTVFNRGMFNSPVEITLRGQNKINWKLNLPNSTNLTGTSSSNQIHLVLGGFLITGGGVKG